MQAVEGKAPHSETTREHLCQWVPEDVRSRCRVSEIVLNGDAAEQIILSALSRKD